MTRTLRLCPALCVGAALAFAAACTSSGSTSTSPTAPTGANLNGTWTTSVTVSGASGRMTWALTQSGSAVSGPVTVAVSSGIVLLNGSLSGTATDTSLVYTITVPAGGLPLQPTCSGQLQGTMTIASPPTSMSGPMNLTQSSCTSPISTQTITMTKQ
jgi:hypothetical protein